MAKSLRYVSMYGAPAKTISHHGRGHGKAQVFSEYKIQYDKVMRYQARKRRRMILTDVTTNHTFFAFKYECFRSYLSHMTVRPEYTIHRNHLENIYKMVGSVIVLNEDHPDLDPVSDTEREENWLLRRHGKIRLFLDSTNDERFKVTTIHGD